MQRIVQIITLGSAIIMSFSAVADLSNEKLLNILLENGAINQAQYDELTKLALEDSEKAKQQLVDEVKVSVKGGHLKFKSGDDEFKFQVGGRILVDTAWYNADDNLDPDLNWGNGTELRSARLLMEGTAWKNWHFKLEYDFAGDGGLRDIYIKYTGLKQYTDFPLTIIVGNYKEPFSLEELTSARFITFMERALPGALVPGRNIGVGLNTYGNVLNGGWSAAGGWFTDGVDNENDDGNNESNAFAGRLTFAPIATKTEVMHVGGAVEYRNYDDSTIRFRNRPEAHTAEHRMVDTGSFLAEDTLKWGLEAAGVYGPFSVQGEYIQTNINNVNRSSADADLYGWYAYGSWFITGESRKYSAKRGVFGRIRPNGIVGKGGWGAWELAGRYSSIDLTDGPLDGFKENDITIGLNWYATPTIRFMANYIIADSDNPKFNDPDIFQLRGQIDF